jgi:hypothetical protein
MNMRSSFLSAGSARCGNDTGRESAPPPSAPCPKAGRSDGRNVHRRPSRGNGCAHHRSVARSDFRGWMASRSPLPACWCRWPSSTRWPAGSASRTRSCWCWGAWRWAWCRACHTSSSIPTWCYSCSCRRCCTRRRSSRRSARCGAMPAPCRSPQWGSCWPPRCWWRFRATWCSACHGRWRSRWGRSSRPPTRWRRRPSCAGWAHPTASSTWSRARAWSTTRPP